MTATAARPRRWRLLVAAGGLLLGQILSELHLQGAERRYRAEGEFLDWSGGRLHYRTAGRPRGTAPTVLLVHGSDGVMNDWPLSPLWPELQRYHLLLYDRPGHGFSTAARVSVRDNAEALEALLAAHDYRDLYVLGHSYGATVALAHALHLPGRIRGMALFSPVTHPARGLINPLSYLAFFPPTRWLLLRALLLPAGRALVALEGRRAFAPYPMPPAWSDLMLALSRRRSQAYALAQENRHMPAELAVLSQEYARLRLPLRLLAGSGDRMTPPDVHVAPLVRLLDVPARVVPGGSHQLHWTHPLDVADELRALLEGTTG